MGDKKCVPDTRTSAEVEVWKRQNCFREHNDLCKECCSGGMMYGATCKNFTVPVEFYDK